MRLCHPTSEVINAHRLRWCQWILGHRSGYFVRPKTTKSKSNCRLVPTKARSMSKMDGGSEATTNVS